MMRKKKMDALSVINTIFMLLVRAILLIAGLSHIIGLIWYFDSISIYNFYINSTIGLSGCVCCFIKLTRVNIIYLVFFLTTGALGASLKLIHFINSDLSFKGGELYIIILCSFLFMFCNLLKISRK
jgi:hypothetical protein